MYITYCRNQQALNVVDTTEHRLNTTGGDYRPTYLMRVSDWKKVPGHEAKNGYCALSYVWAQSGQVVRQEDGEYECIDQGQHCIIDDYDMGSHGFFTQLMHYFGIKMNDSATMIPPTTAEEEEKNGYSVQFSPSALSKATIRHVTYNELIQQVCKDFQIEYIWYDKLCIEQSDHDIRLREIKQMYLIYGNARYTVAMVPEVHVYNPEDLGTIHPFYEETKAGKKAWVDIVQKSLWWKRSWTLEETMMSKRILVVGTDTHLWQHGFQSCDIPTTSDCFSLWMLDFTMSQEQGGSVNQALNQAHFRTSTKEHDKIISLAHIFPEKFKNMKLDYKSDVQAAFHHFYQTMATHDLSILCFASNFLPGGTKVLANTMGNNRLPSWTGVSGRHLTERVTAITSFLDSPHFVDNDMLLHVPTKYYKIISVTPYDFGYFSPVSHDDPRWGCQKVMFEERSQSIRNSDSVEEETAFIDWAIKLQNVSTSFATHYYPSPPAQGKECASAMETRPLSLTEDCTECVLLPILLKAYKFLVHPVKESSLLKHPDNDHHHYYLPVFKKFYYEDPTTTPIVMYERYFAIGIYYLGTPYFGDLRSDDPNEILNSVFQGDAVHDEVKEFVIE